MSKHHQEIIRVETNGKRLYDVTDRVAEVVAASGVATGLCTVFIQHTSASLCIQENAAPAVQRDILVFLERIAPESGRYEHDDEGPDDMPAHLRTLLTKTTETIPVGRGRLLLGTWQGIYVMEHRAARHTRSLVIHVAGE
jgi:secondary thiamine-phosphate synthase enzyme